MKKLKSFWRNLLASLAYPKEAEHVEPYCNTGCRTSKCVKARGGRNVSKT